MSRADTLKVAPPPSCSYPGIYPTKSVINFTTLDRANYLIPPCPFLPFSLAVQSYGTHLEVRDPI